jgi:hypothetical protein
MIHNPTHRLRYFSKIVIPRSWTILTSYPLGLFNDLGPISWWGAAAAEFEFLKPRLILPKDLVIIKTFRQALQLARMHFALRLDQRIVNPDRLPPIIDKACVFQVGHVARNIGLGKLEHFHELADTEFSFQEEMESPETRLIGKSLEEPCYFFHGVPPG